ncbi:hypothetical protein [Nocardia sienata]|uniref:hypothetical protein n=1 Tax=Nocardia sienata TaxID=248552 RepID=UPI000ADCE2E2|nr:hypothetical protein [Nocardia sienata]
MTEENPPEHERAEQTKWWETPGGAGEPGPDSTPGADPTMVNPNAAAQFPSGQNPHPAAPPYSSDQQAYPSGRQPYASEQQPYASGQQQQYPGGQQHPSGQQQHPSGGQQFPSAQQQYSSGQQYAGGQQPYPAPGPAWQSGPSHFGTPTGYGAAAAARSRSKNNTALIVVGVVLFVILLICGIGGIALVNSDSGSEGAGGDYGMENVTNACDLVDASVLDQWAANRDETTHQEHAPASYGGGSLDCQVDNEGTGSNSARLGLDVTFDSEYGSYGYDDWKKSDTATTGTDYSSGAVNGLGEDAYYSSQVNDYSSFQTLDYTVAAKDSNISVKVDLYISYDGVVDRSTVDRICRDQIRKVLDELRK